MNSEPNIPGATVLPGDVRGIRRILLTSGWFGALVSILLWIYAGWPWGVGFAAGGILGAVNLIFLTALVVELLRPAGRRGGRIAALLAVKMPVVYGGLAALLLWKETPLAADALGFSLVLAVIFLKAAGQALAQSGLFGPPPQGRGDG